jgi:hypothetical protein
MSGGKGGSTSQKVTIPDWLQQPAQRNLARAEEAAKVGYMPYYGPDVAAFTPMQQQAMQANVDAASAFGLVPQGTQAMAGMPQAQDFGGVQGYSSGSMFDQALQELASRRPGQYAQYTQQFVDPMTGIPVSNFDGGHAQVNPAAAQFIPGMRDGGGSDDGGMTGGTSTPIGQGGTLAEMLGERYNQMSTMQKAFTPGAMILGGGADAALRGSGYTYNPYGGQLEGGSYVSDSWSDYGAKDDGGGSYDSFDGGSGGKFSDDSSWGGGYSY